MTIKQQGGVFGRNPTFNDVEIDGTITASSVDINGGAIDGVTLGTNSPVTNAQIDNININGNVISSTDTDGDVIVNPNGTGQFIVYAPQTYTDDALFTTSDGVKVTLANTNNFASAEETVGYISFFGGDNSSPADSERAFIKAVYTDNANRVRIDIGTGNAAEAAATALSISPQKNVTVSTGNLVIGTSGKGIDFSATSDGSGTTTSELFSDYEEGTFSVSAARVTDLTTNVARYTKVGNIVTCEINLSWTATDNSGNDVIFTGLPFTTATGTETSVGPAMVYGTDVDTDVGAAVVIRVDDNQTRFFLVKAMNSSLDAINASAMNSATTLRSTFTYTVS